MLFSTRSRWRGGEKLLVKWATQSDQKRRVPAGWSTCVHLCRESSPSVMYCVYDAYEQYVMHRVSIARKEREHDNIIQSSLGVETGLVSSKGAAVPESNVKRCALPVAPKKEKKTQNRQKRFRFSSLLFSAFLSFLYQYIFRFFYVLPREREREEVIRRRKELNLIALHVSQLSFCFSCLLLIPLYPTVLLSFLSDLFSPLLSFSFPFDSSDRLYHHAVLYIPSIGKVEETLL